MVKYREIGFSNQIDDRGHFIAVHIFYYGTKLKTSDFSSKQFSIYLCDVERSEV